jgi:limonene-1,2-epoxide hydrolase
MTPNPPPDAQATVIAFLTALAASDVEGAGALLAEDVVYANVGLPTIRGRRGVLRVLGPLAGHRARFEVYLHAVAADGAQVLTERTDVIEFGRLRFQFWVAGRFDVHDGRITLWRDAFDFLDCTRAALRGLLGALVPALRPRPPATSGPPGRR